MFFNHGDAVQHLIDTGADVNAVDSLAVKSTPLIPARRGTAGLGCSHALHVWSQIGRQDVQGDTALHVAARAGHFQMVKLLLSCRGGRRTDGTRRYFFDEINPASVEDEGVEGMVLSPSSGASASQFSAHRYTNLLLSPGRSGILSFGCLPCRTTSQEGH